MHEVDHLNFPDVSRPATQIWTSAIALDGIVEYARRGQPQGRMMMLLKRFSKNGFRLYEGGEGAFIKHEWDGVYRVGFGSLFRVIGFYEDGSRADFIAIDAFTKRKQKLSAAERGRIDEVARVLRSQDWRKKDNGNYPRLAEGT